MLKDARTFLSQWHENLHRNFCWSATHAHVYLAAFFGIVALFPCPLRKHVRRVGTFYHRSAVVTFDSHGVQCGGQEGHVRQSRCAVWRTRGGTFDSHDLQCGEHEGRSWVRRLSRHIWGGMCVILFFEFLVLC